VGRLGAAFIPYLLFPIISYNLYFPFLIFGVCGFIGAISAKLLPFDTKGRTLD